MGKHWLGLLAPALLLAGGIAMAETAPEQKETKPLSDRDTAAINHALIDRLSQSMVTVDYYFKADELGKMPDYSVRYKCSGCGRYHSRGVDDLVIDERPMRVPGYLIAPDELISSDLQIAPGWLKKIEVEYRGHKVPAEIVGDYPDHQSVRLKLKAPLAGTAPLVFSPDASGKRFTFVRSEEDSIPVARTRPYGDNQIFRDLISGQDWLSTPANSLMVTADGKVLALFMTDRIPLKEKRTGSPADWKFRPVAEITADREKFAEYLRRNCYLVKIKLTPPPTSKTLERMYGTRDNDGENSNDISAVGIKLKDGRLLVRAYLTPQRTARIDSIKIFDGDRTIPASFVGSLQYYGAMVIKPQQQIPGDGIELSSATPGQLLHHTAWITEIKAEDDKLEIKPIPCRIEGFPDLLRGFPIPEYSRSAKNGWLFAANRQLVALPLGNRARASDYGNNKIVPAPLLTSLLHSDSGFDPRNIPLDRKQRNRIAWLGVICQPMDKKLAEANQVSNLTSDGETGLLINSVYPGSPAETLHLKPGDILLTIKPEKSGQQIKLGGYQFADNLMERNFPWDKYDQIPEMYYDQIPHPWSTLQNKFNTMLTSLGIGNRIKLVAIVDGKPVNRELTLEAAPERYETAEKVTHQDLGLTVCNPTFEVRQYFRLKPDAPGILVSRVRPGSPASTAGIKPYELLLSLNNKPLKSVADFTPPKDAEMSLAVSRMGESRIVKLKPAAPPVGPRADTAR